MALNQQDFEKLKTQLAAQKVQPSASGDFFSEIGASLKNRFSQAKQGATEQISKAKEAFDSGNVLETGKALGRSGLRVAGAAGNAIGDVAGEVISKVTPDAIGDKAIELATPVLKPVMEKFNALKESNPQLAQDIEDALGITEILGLGAATKPAKAGLNAVANSVSTTMSAKLPRVSSIPEFSSKLGEFLAKDVDGKAATILKETPTATLDKYIKYGEEASLDPRKFTPFDYVGDRMEEATKILVEKMKKAGAEKSEFVKPLNQGFDVFSGKSLVDDLTSLNNRLPESGKSFLKPFIEKAKAVKVKSQADQLVDEIQDAVKTAGAQNLIPKGSALQRQLSGVVGKFNEQLKKSLPPKYGQLNAQYSNLKKITDALNKALGEVIDGQSTRGGSLVKQFFSPSGKRAKTIFDFVKKETGIDLAQETVLARFAMELFDDPRANSLLEGIPKSASSLIDKTIDFTIDKTGIGKSAQKALREAEIRKARKITK